MLVLRLRVPELLAKRGLTPYALARRSAGRISMSTAYRLRENDGRLETFSATLLEGLLDVLAVNVDELIERVPDRRKGK